jgi:4-hydroxybenzoate polyprenyltransferase
MLVFITELRFMDELKDYEKDKIAHPTRPLPRGLITVGQVRNLIIIFFSLLCLLSFLSAVIFNPLSGILLGIVTIWLFLMYKEFFIEEVLNKSPIFYAITHQIIIVPLILFLIAITNPEEVFSGKNYAFAALILSSFFTFEVGRKMDPNAHTILGTYLVHYKTTKTHILIVALASLGLIGGILLNHMLWVLIPFILILITQVRVLKNEKIFKDLEGIIALNLIYNMWFLAIAGWIR